MIMTLVTLDNERTARLILAIKSALIVIRKDTSQGFAQKNKEEAEEAEEVSKEVHVMQVLVVNAGH